MNVNDIQPNRKFHVLNGNWTGYITIEGRVKYMHVLEKGSKIEIESDSNVELDIWYEGEDD